MIRIAVILLSLALVACGKQPMGTAAAAEMCCAEAGACTKFQIGPIDEFGEMHATDSCWSDGACSRCERIGES
jgi:hypothetical protein